MLMGLLVVKMHLLLFVILCVNWLIKMVSFLFSLNIFLWCIFTFSLGLTDADYDELTQLVAAMRRRVAVGAANEVLRNFGLDPESISNEFNATLQLNFDDLLEQ